MELVDVSVLALSGSPDLYAGKGVHVTGYVKIEEDFDHGLHLNAIALDLDETRTWGNAVSDRYQGYAIIEGTFAPQRNGTRGRSAGRFQKSRDLKP